MKRDDFCYSDKGADLFASLGASAVVSCENAIVLLDIPEDGYITVKRTEDDVRLVGRGKATCVYGSTYPVVTLSLLTGEILSRETIDGYPCSQAL